MLEIPFFNEAIKKIDIDNDNAIFGTLIGAILLILILIRFLNINHKQANERTPMYTLKPFKISNLDQIVKFLKVNDFCTILSQAGGKNQISHLPLSITRTPGSDQITLTGHMAKANTHWKLFLEKPEVTCIFTGPHSYISPRFYVETKTVPTWNYSAVHVTGKVELITDPEKVIELMDEMIQDYDPELLDPSSPYYLPKDEKDSSISHVVGFKITVSNIEAKFKLGQNRTVGDQEKLMSTLFSSPDDMSKNLAKLMQETTPTLRHNPGLAFKFSK